MDHQSDSAVQEEEPSGNVHELPEEVGDLFDEPSDSRERVGSFG
jgi:hypothetical protein